MTKIIGKEAQVNEWLEAVNEMRSAQADTIPKQFITMEEFAKEIELSVPASHVIMRGLIASGMAEKRMFMVYRNGYLRRIPYYIRIKKKK